MGKTRKDRRDRDYDYKHEKSSAKRRKQRPPRRQPDSELRQYRNISADEIPDDFLVEND